MNIMINGNSRETSAQISIAGLLAEQNLDKSSVVVELNEQIIDSSYYLKTVLKEGDRLEILSFVGGG